MSERYYRHVDGGLYRFVVYARSADTERDTVVYEHLWPFDRGTWVRDREEFESRFAPVDASAVEAAMREDRQLAQTAVRVAKAKRRGASVSG